MVPPASGAGRTGATPAWPTGSCPVANGTNWRALLAHDWLNAATVASTTAPGVTTASLRIGMKVPSSQAPGTCVEPVAFEVTAPSS